MVATLPSGSTGVLWRRNVTAAQIAIENGVTKRIQPTQRVHSGQARLIGQSLPNPQPASRPRIGTAGGNGNFLVSVGASIAGVDDISLAPQIPGILGGAYVDPSRYSLCPGNARRICSYIRARAGKTGARTRGCRYAANHGRRS